MECQEFLEGYSEYLDGRLAGEEGTPFEVHMDACDGCRRYDRVIRRGVKVWRSIPEVEPSPDFLPRLRHRLYHVDDAARLAAERPLGSAALVAVAAVGLLALAWLPFATQMSVEVQLPAVAVQAPAPASASAPSLFGPGPFLSPEASPTPSYARPAFLTGAPPGSSSWFSSAPLFAPDPMGSMPAGTVAPLASGDTN